MKRKANTVITTDGEVDDMNSMIRLFLYSNEMNIEGIILTSSMYHYANPPYRWTGTKWLFDFIDRYEKVYPNLIKHDPEFISPQQLRKITKIGNIDAPGDMQQETEGSAFLESLFLKERTEPLYVQTWGGTNTTARALKSIEEKFPHLKEIVSKNIIIYIILDQDETYQNYIQKHWPHIKVIQDKFSFWHFAYAYQFHDDRLNQYLKAAYMKDLKMNHGPLLEKYALMGDGHVLEGELYEELRGTDDYLLLHPEYERYDFISEGDSPSFLYLIDNGLRSLEDPSYGGWGGRFKKVNDFLYTNQAFDYNPYTNQYEVEYNLIRWFDDLQKDFFARAKWCVTHDENQISHPPQITIAEGNDIDVFPGKTIVLHAKGDEPLTYHWWRYFEADTYHPFKETNIKTTQAEGLIFSQTHFCTRDESVILENTHTSTCTIHLPNDLKQAETIHIICEASNKDFKRYQRIILKSK